LKAGRFSGRDASARLEQALQKGPIRFLLLLAFAMILYGSAIGYGFRMTTRICSTLATRHG
jgi:hypothetical protein